VEVVITHLTRMRAPHICVAGIDTETMADVRPLPRYGRLAASDLRFRSGCFELGSVVDLGEVVARPSPPETEDVEFDRGNAVIVGQLSDDEFWARLEACAAVSLREIFGDELARDGRTASIASGRGTRSLGYLHSAGRASLNGDAFGRVRLLIDDPELGALRLPVNDLRLFDPVTGEARDRPAELLQDRVRRCEAILAVGLSRPWAREDDEPRHWLQVNNIHLDDNPLWQPSSG
jgi:hypothetical protein